MAPAKKKPAEVSEPVAIERPDLAGPVGGYTESDEVRAAVAALDSKVVAALSAKAGEPAEAIERGYLGDPPAA